MANLSHSGMGWANGEISGGNGRILALPSPDLLMLSSEHWHHDEAVRAGRKVLFRGMARQGFRPAEVGWDVRRYVDEITRDAVRVSEPIQEFVAWNELNLQEERGDQRSDHGDLNHLYGLIGQFCLGVISELRRRPVTKNALLHFGAFAPKDETDYTHHWKAAAEAVDCVDVHAYGRGEGILGHISKYRALFANKHIQLTEWHSDGAGPDEDRLTLELLARLAEREPRFRAYYFLWRWHNPPAHQRALADAIAVEGNSDRLALFLNPPLAGTVDGGTTEPDPTLPEEPADPGQPDPGGAVYRVPAWTPAYADIRDGAIEVADQMGMPRRRLLGLCLAESGFGLQSFDRWASTERSQRMKAAIDAQDWPLLERIFLEIAGAATNDISFGPAHQSWWWSLSAAEQQAHPEWRHDLTRIMDFRAHLIEDHGSALRRAAGTLNSLRDRFGRDDDQFLLERYNKPNGEVSAEVRANYQRGLSEADRILGQVSRPVDSPTDPIPPSSIIYEDYRDPGHALFARMPKGVVLHGSRSGRAGNPLEQEYTGTANWELNNPNGYAWHATIGGGKVAVHLTPQEWGQHDPWASQEYLGVEFAQPTVNDAITDSQVDAFADWFKVHVLPAWPSIPRHFPSHAEVDQEYGQNQGKSDAFPLGDPRMDDLRQRIMARLETAPVEPPAPPEPPAPTDELATLRAENAVLRADLDAARSKLGVATVDIPNALEREVEAILASGHAAQAAINTLRAQKP